MEQLFGIAGVLHTLLDSLGSVGQLSDSAGQFLRFTAQIADGGGGAGDESIRGAVGNIISAHLQTKGMIDQAKILSDFQESLESAAALFWLFSVALGIGAFAMFGNYRQGLYLLIGPPLFFFVTTVTVETDGIELRFGEYTAVDAKSDANKMLRHIKAIDSESGATVEVSRFFAFWDAIVTEATQAVVSLLVKTGEKEHLRLVARERMLNFVIQSAGDNEGFIRLVSASYYGECGSTLPHYQRTHTLRRPAPVEVGNNLSAKRSETLANDLASKPGAPLDRTAKGFVIAMKNAGIEGFENVYITDPDQPFNPSCEQIFGYVAGASRFIAKRRLTKESFIRLFAGDTSGIPLDLALQDVLEFLARMFSGGGKSDEEKARDLVGAYVFKNTLERTSLAALTSQAFNRSPSNGAEHEDITQILAKTEGHSGFMKVVYFANAIPYVQGFLLYILSIAFPFFAIFLVVPSRATSFLAWLGLWAWVKSWDVGFALVHVARKVMWYMMQGRINMHGEDLNWEDPVSIISVLYNNDPFYTQNTYWMVISTLTLAVPFVTAHFFLGATGMFDLFSGTIDQTADRFGQIERNRSRRFVANVNEHLQRVNSFRISSTAGLAHLRQKTMSQQDTADGKDEGASLAQAQAEGSYDEGAATMDGRQLEDGSHGASAHRVGHAATGFTLGQMFGTIGTKNFTNQQTAERAKAYNGGKDSQAHYLRGTIPMDAKVDLKSLQQMYGKTSTANKLHQEGITWGELYHKNSRYQQQNQAFTASITGRRMTGPMNSAEQSQHLMTARSQQMQFMRDPSAAAKTAPLVAEALGITGQLENLSDLTKPSSEYNDSISVKQTPVTKD